MALNFYAKNSPMMSGQVPSVSSSSLPWPIPEPTPSWNPTDTENAYAGLPQNVRNSAEFRVAEYNNAVAREEAKINRDFNQSSAREAMEFEASQAEIQRNFQQSSAREAMEFEANQAQIARDWTAEQSNTAYQRAVADLKAAGLNPALAYMNGGASTTAGSSAGGFMSTGSSARGISASGSNSPVDMQSVIDMMQTTATNANSKQIAILNGLFGLGKELIHTVGSVASTAIRGPSKGLNVSQYNYNG